MKLTSITPMLRVPSIEAALRFYSDILGFRCLERSDEWAAVERDGIELMLALPNAHMPFLQAQFTGSLYFRTDEVDTWWNALKDKAAVVYPIENFEYGMREFAILDNNGYCLQFGTQLL